MTCLLMNYIFLMLLNLGWCPGGINRFEISEFFELSAFLQKFKRSKEWELAQFVWQGFEL